MNALKVVSFSAIALVGCSAPSPLVGTYGIVSDDDMFGGKSFRSDVDKSKIKLVLRNDNTFEFLRVSGSYTIAGDMLELRPQSKKNALELIFLPRTEWGQGKLISARILKDNKLKFDATSSMSLILARESK